MILISSGLNMPAIAINLKDKISSITEKFNKVHGQDALMNFIATTNEEHIYSQEFNRAGAIYLPTYFMACALKESERVKNEIWEAFIKTATTPGNGSNKEMTPETAAFIKNKIIEAATPLSATLVAKNDNDDSDPTAPSPETYAA